MTMNRRCFIQASAGALAGLWLSGWRNAFSADTDAKTIVFHNGVVLPVDGGYSAK